MATYGAEAAGDAPTGKGFRNTGIAFATFGFLAVLVPAVATLVVEQLTAIILVIWGIVGIIMSLNFRSVSEWRIVAVGFAAMLALGIMFLVYPAVGAKVMTALLVVAFVTEGVLSILLGLRMSGQLPNWRWVVASGACSFVLGMMLLYQWPLAATSVIGVLVGLNFLSTGIVLLLISRSLRST